MAQAAAAAAAAAVAPKVKRQAAIQCGATPGEEGRPRFLAYTTLGAIVRNQLSDHASIKVRRLLTT